MPRGDFGYTVVAMLNFAFLIVYLVWYPDPINAEAIARRVDEAARPEDDQGVAWENCSSAYGSLNGVGGGVPAYSNCNSSYTGSQYNFLSLESLFGNNEKPCDDWSGCPSDVMAGLEWQCVEYARRSLLLGAHHAAFGSVDGACDMWGLENVTKYALRRTQGTCRCEVSTRPWKAIANRQPASAGVWVQPGDLVIYPSGAVGPFGHVCVVLRVDVGSSATTADSSNVVARVFVGEQNWNNAPWPVTSGDGAYARVLLLVRDETGSFTVLQDSPEDGLYAIYGVKRM